MLPQYTNRTTRLRLRGRSKLTPWLPGTGGTTFADERKRRPELEPPAAAASLLTGRSLGSYRLDALLGAGGMGEVYRAHDTRLDRSVAIKILPGAFTADRDRLARLEREARMLAALNHPNICAIH